MTPQQPPLPDPRDSFLRERGARLAERQIEKRRQLPARPRVKGHHRDCTCAFCLRVL
jgi:hypothetical protein